MKTKKSFKRSLSCILAGAACSLSMASAFPVTGYAAGLPVSEPLSIHGTIQKEGNDLLLSNIPEENIAAPVLLKISEQTRLLDAQNGFPVSFDSLKDGESVHAYIGQAMTMSLPPQVNAEIVLSGIDSSNADRLFYETVDYTAYDHENGIFYFTTGSGKMYCTDSSSELLPYLTRNIVTTEQLVKGSVCLIWTSDNPHKADKLVLFPENRFEADK